MIDRIRVDFMKKYMMTDNRNCENSWSTVYGKMSKDGVFRRMKEARKAGLTAQHRNMQ